MTAEQAIPTPQEQLLARLDALEGDLARLSHQLEHADRLATLGILAAGVAHEVRNALTPALGYAQLVAEDDGAVRAKAAGRIEERIKDALRILEATVGFSTPAADEPPEAIVQECLAAALDCLGRDLARDRIQLVTSIPETARVSMAPISLQQVFLNLLLNARRALAGEGGMIEIDADPSPESLTIRVSDDGPGLPEELGDPFEPFATAAPSDSAGAGTGLGLAVCRRAVDAAGGEISAESKPGHGATFTIKLRTPHRAA